VAASDRSHDVGGTPGWECRGLHPELPGVAGTLRGGGGSDQCGQRPRERGLRTGTPTLQGGVGAGTVAAWQPRLRQPGGVPAVRARPGGPTQRRAGCEVPGRGGPAAAVAGASAGDPGAATGEGQPGEHDPGQEEYLLGTGPVDRGVAGSALGRRGPRGVVRGCAGPSDGAAARAVQASHRLSARDRLAGTQAWGLCPLRLSRGVVPECDLPAGLRCAGGAAARACRPGLRADFVPGGPGGRGAGPGGVGQAAGRAATVERAGRAAALGA
jgi:hypothetical protein